MVRGMKGACAGALAAIALAVVPATAGAQDAVSVYSPNSEDRTFATSPGSFTGGSASLGLCIPAVTCPTVDNHHVATGGTTGDGFLRSEFGALAGVAGTTFASWTQQQPWIYNGANGQRPDELVATVARNSNLNALLDVVGNEADYVVQLLDDSAGGQAVTVIQGDLEPTGGWTSSGLVPIQRDTLVIGHAYRFRIVSVLTYGAEVVAGGRADYDDLALIATREADDDGNGGGGGGGGRGGGNPGGRNAFFDGRNLFIKLRCFGEQGDNGKCLTRATALKSRKGARYTFPIQRVVKAKKGKIIRARVRFQYRKELEKRNSVVLKSVLRTDRDDESKEIKYKRLKLIDRSQQD
ncbi:MAG TPA: hypothetical protein VHF58_05365 [Solirubrobacterales bacterium]|nr:hypothetical protein [Solirubrobacterales bacterium]